MLMEVEQVAKANMAQDDGVVTIVGEGPGVSETSDTGDGTSSSSPHPQGPWAKYCTGSRIGL